MAGNMFAWDLLFRSVEKDITKREDLLVAFTHWYFIKTGFICVGPGTARSLVGNEIRTEMLPPSWNKMDDYNLRYAYEDKLYLFRGTVTGRDIIFNFLRAQDLSITSCMFQIDEEVKAMKGNIVTVLPNYKHIMEVLKNDLISPIFIQLTNVVGTQTPDLSPMEVRQQQQQQQNPFSSDIVDPLRIYPRPGPDPFWNPPLDPGSIGRNDVDPFAPGIGGGMLYDPFRPRRDPRGPGPSFPDGLPRGSVPPGARFDPFRPPVPGRGGRLDPDPDHLPPPGSDDMFM